MTTVANEVLTLVQHAIRTYPKRLTALIAALALGGAGGAFAIASLAPDVADLPVREVTEAVQPLSTLLIEQSIQPLVANLSASTLPDIGPLTLYRSDVSRANDTADTLLKRMGISDTAAAAFLRADPLVRKSLWSRAGRNISAEASDDHSLLKLVARWMPTDDGNFSRLIVEKTPLGMTSRVETAPLAAATRLASGTITSSLFAATDAAGLPDSIGVQVAEIFAGDIDFHRALRKGDRFSITYEALEADGEPMRSGRVLSAEFVNNGKTYQAMWFAHQTAVADKAAAKGAYYTLDGKSLRRAYLASPLEFSRVTSGFQMRLHPIHQTWKAHLGVDYAAPTGTPVRTIGDGVVEFAGVQSGYGNVVTVNHGKENATVYAHLSKINVQKGQKVSQSDIIGLVGSTGWSTGPHLHFEFRVNGVHHDPLTIARQSESLPINTAAKAQFDSTAAMVRVALAAAGSIQQASAQ
jgi:murein DD-endopeptidase MepM/ murein hydrolase activator NlpD